MTDYVSFRDRDRGKYQARPAIPLAHRRRRVKTPPANAVPCRVKDALGRYYDFMGKQNGNYLFENWKVVPEGHLFPSRHQASRAVWHTIKRMQYEGMEWEDKDFFLENVT